MKRYEVGRKFKVTLLLLYMGIRFFTMYQFITGIILLILSMFFYFTSGGLRIVMEPPFEDSKEYKDCVLGRGYNWEEALQREKISRESLREELKDYWKYMVAGGLVFLLGFALSFIFMVLAQGFPLFTGHYFTIPIEFYGLTLIWHGFVNSDLKNAKSVSDAFLINSLPRRIERSTKMIRALQKRVEMENKQDKEQKKEWENEQENEREKDWVSERQGAENRKEQETEKHKEQEVARAQEKSKAELDFEKEYERVFGKKWGE